MTAFQLFDQAAILTESVQLQDAATQARASYLAGYSRLRQWQIAPNLSWPGEEYLAAARRFLDRAVQLDPTNQTYLSAWRFVSQDQQVPPHNAPAPEPDTRGTPANDYQPSGEIAGHCVGCGSDFGFTAHLSDPNSVALMARTYPKPLGHLVECVVCHQVYFPCQRCKKAWAILDYYFRMQDFAYLCPDCAVKVPLQF